MCIIFYGELRHFVVQTHNGCGKGSANLRMRSVVFVFLEIGISPRCMDQVKRAT